MKLFVKASGKQGESRKYLFFYHSKAAERSNRYDYWTPVPALRQAWYRCTDSPIPQPPLHSIPINLSVCVHVCVSPITLPAVGIQGIKRIVSEIASEGWRWSVVGGRVEAVHRGGVADGRDPEFSWNYSASSPPTPPHLFMLQVKAPNCMHDPPPYSPSSLLILLLLLIKRQAETSGRWALRWNREWMAAIEVT